MMKLVRIFILYFLAFNGDTYAQLKLEVSTAPKEVYVNEPFSLQFTIKGTTQIRQFRQPAHPNLRYISDPFQSAMEENINGKVSKIFSVSFTVVMNQAGTFTLPAAAVNTGNQVHHFPELKVKVHAGKRLNADTKRKQENPFETEEWPTERAALEQKIRNEVFIRLETNKKSCYNGEPILAEYKLYSRLKCESKLTKNPSFIGFSVTDIPPQNEPEERTDTFQGREFNVYTIRKVQLIPLQPGKFIIEKAELENNVYLIPPGISTDPFDPNYNPYLTNVRVHPITLTSNEVEIEVLPLPQNPPDDFKGAVGDVDFHATLSQYVFPLQKEGKLILKVEGTGNLQLLTPPVIEWPKGLDPLEAKVQDDFNYTDQGVSGSRMFILPFLVNQPGKYSLPPVSFTVFNPNQKQYERLTSDALEFHVLEATEQTGEIPSQKTSWIHRNRILLLLAAAGLMTASLWYVWFRRKRKPASPANPVVDIPETVRVDTPVSEEIFTQTTLALQQGNVQVFYNSLYHELKLHMCTLLQLPSYTDIQTIVATLDQKGVPKTLYQTTENLFNELEMNMYAPVAHAHSPEALFKQAQELVASFRLYFQQA